ncbi:MAG: transposase [Chloroflexi bacterium]|nr:transposase [Chloroflexota bacterium]
MKDIPHCKEYYSLSAQATRDEVIQAYKSYFTLHKNRDTKARQPGFRRKTTYSNLRYYKGYGFKLKGNKLALNFGLHKTSSVKNVEVEIQHRSDIEFTRVINVLITYDKKHGLQAHLVVDTKAVTALGDNVVAVDLGETQLLTVMFGDGKTLMYSGREIKALRRYWQKVRRKVKPPVEGRKKSRRYSQIDVKESRQVSHRLHIITRDFVNRCYKAGVNLIVIGDLTGIRASIDYGKATNQRLHAWSFAKVVEMIRYKADMLGMKVVQIPEAHTSKTCHKCTTCAKSNRKSRGYTKCSCGWKAHADVNAAANIFGAPQTSLH